MVPSLPASTETLVWLAKATSILHNDDYPLAVRMDSLLTFFDHTLHWYDVRITCWLQSAQPGTQRQQFVSSTPRLSPWDDGLMRQTALGGKIVSGKLTLKHAPAYQTRKHQPSEPVPPENQVKYLGVPIVWSGRVWGVLELRTHDTTTLGKQAREFMNALLPQLAVAIAREGVRMQQRPLLSEPGQHTHTPHNPYTTTTQHLPLSLLNKLEAPLSLDELLPLLLHWALDTTRAEAGIICLVDHERGELVLHVAEGYESDSIAPENGHGHGLPQRWSWETGLAGRAARTGRALLVRDVTQEQDVHLTTVNLRAELAAPIMLEERALAVLVLDSPRSAAFGEPELAIINTLCKHAAQPLHRAITYQEIVETSTQLGQVFTSLPTGLALLDNNGQVLRTNPAWAVTWGLPEDTQAPFHVPLDLTDALLPRLPDPLHLTDFCNSDQRIPAEVQMTTVRLNNPAQELQVLSVPTRDSRGQITGRLWAITDITRNREADRLKNEFVSIVSHELRTPLTSILGYTELLLARSFAPSEQRQFVQTVYDQANHLSKLVEDLLSLSRLDSNKMRLNCWVVSLRQIIGELTSQLGQLERHRLLIRMNDPLPPVYIDRDKVKQVLFNLLTNAIKYSPNGGEIELVVQESSKLPADHLQGKTNELQANELVVQQGYKLPTDHPQGRWLVVSIRDQGIGIAPEDLPRIWQRFYRVDNTNTRRIGGTGLGLSIASALVELHGGRIWVDSVLDRGSTFFFTLPIANESRQYGE